MSAYVWIIRFPEELSAEDFLKYYKAELPDEYEELKDYYQEELGREDGHNEEIIETFQKVKENIVYEKEGIDSNIVNELVSYLEKEGCLVHKSDIGEWTHIVVNLTALEKENDSV